MRTPEQVTTLLRQRFDGEYPDWARGGGTWPLRVPLRPPSPSVRAASPVACHAWADQWRAYAGPGTLVYANLRFPTGTHAMPRAVLFHRPGHVAAVDPETQQTWQRCGRRLLALQKAFPQARFDGVIRRIAELDETDYQRLTDTVAWLQDHPTSGMLLRQMPIEGIDTKWLARHATLVLAMLGDPETDPADEPDEPDGQTRRLRLHRRLGLRTTPDLVQVAVLDPNLRANLAGMRHFAASIDDLNQWRHRPSTVVIIENKETGYALTDDYANVVALHGGGLSVAHYARITWVRDARKVIYWGDIDAAGLQFVNDLRGHGVDLTTVMMDVETLDRFHNLAVQGAAPRRNVLPHLTGQEHALYQRLVDHAANHGTGVLLEQERIPWHVAHPTLTAMIKDVPRDMGTTT